MRNDLPSYLCALAACMIAPGCGSHPDIQCGTNSDCDLHFGGACTSAPTGNQWCSYPDPSCPSGTRYSDQQVGDGVSGQCVTMMTDAGIDTSSSLPATSCIALPYMCGASGNDDCCNSPVVMGGTFLRSFDAAGDTNSGNMSASATISTFRLDKYEVTVGRFRAFVDSNEGTQEHPPPTGAGAHPGIPGSGWEISWVQSLPANRAAFLTHLNCSPSPLTLPSTWTDTPGDNEDLPISCLTWYDAVAFCAWDGGYLPTEAEWNYAAAGGNEQRVYPWSSPPASTILDASHASYDCIEDGMPSCGYGDILLVGSRPQGDGRWGQSDLAGNVMEWTLDWGEQYPVPCTDCAYLGPHPNGEREIRGGNWTTYTLVQLRTGGRQTAPAGEQGVDRGVRCARPL